METTVAALTEKSVTGEEKGAKRKDPSGDRATKLIQQTKHYMKTVTLPNIPVKQNKWTIVVTTFQASSYPGQQKISPKVNIYTHYTHSAFFQYNVIYSKQFKLYKQQEDMK